MVTIFPVGTFSIFPIVVFLPSSPRNQLNRFGNHIPVTVVPHKEMDMVGGDGVVQDTEPISLLRLKQPLEITAAVLGKF